MFIYMNRKILDSELQTLSEVLGLLDQLIQTIETCVENSPDPDAEGYLDKMEAYIGLGFVACQQYINATYPWFATTSKQQSLVFPPLHSGGKSYAEIINAAANFWKHNEEWADQENATNEERTRRVLDTVYQSTQDYPLGNILHRLFPSSNLSLSRLLTVLEEWRDGNAKDLKK